MKFNEIRRWEAGKMSEFELTSDEFLGKGGEADEVDAGGNGGNAITCGPVIDWQICQSYSISSSRFLPLLPWGKLIDTFRSDISWLPQKLLWSLMAHLPSWRIPLLSSFSFSIFRLNARIVAIFHIQACQPHYHHPSGIINLDRLGNGKFTNSGYYTFLPIQGIATFATSNWSSWGTSLQTHLSSSFLQKTYLSALLLQCIKSSPRPLKSIRTRQLDSEIFPQIGAPQFRPIIMPTLHTWLPAFGFLDNGLSLSKQWSPIIMCN